MGAIVQYQREHADRAWLLAQIRAASAALVAAGIPDDGRPLAERIAGIDKDIAAAVTREMQSRLDACPISRDRIAALQERARALPETSRDARLLIDDLLSEIQFNALNFSDREDDLLSERDDARDGAKRADEERDAALRAAKVLADGGALGPVANDILDAAALLKRIALGTTVEHRCADPATCRLCQVPTAEIDPTADIMPPPNKFAVQEAPVWAQAFVEAFGATITTGTRETTGLRPRPVVYAVITHGNVKAAREVIEQHVGADIEIHVEVRAEVPAGGAS